MRIFLGLGNVELLHALLCDILAKCVLYILLVKEDVDTCKLGIVWSHTVILQTGDSVHTLGRHILLCEHNSKLLCTVVAVVEEDDSITLAYAAVEVCIHDRLDELVSHALFIRLLDSSNHISRFLALTVNDKVVSNLYTLPTLVTVHSIITANDCSQLETICCKLLNETRTALGVRITAIHETVYISVLNTLLCSELVHRLKMLQ